MGANVHLFKADALIQDPVYLAKLNRPLGATQAKNYRNTMITSDVLQKISWYMEDKFARVKVLYSPGL